MSYTAQDARAEFESMVEGVLRTHDIEGAYHLREVLAEIGDMEEAHRFDKMAKKWEREEWAYDESKDNSI